MKTPRQLAYWYLKNIWPTIYPYVNKETGITPGHQVVLEDLIKMAMDMQRKEESNKQKLKLPQKN